ncbi:MAG TPA: hypothetical protein VNI53_06505 [Gammaproteobacteria bacterium]|nr:hypothetical protein [Gammaproteobacteria bacterium]
MDNARLIGISLVALLWCGCYSAHIQAAENCHTPRPQTLIAWYDSAHPEEHLHYSTWNSLIYHPIEVFQTAQPHINWIGLAWLSPEWGALFAADCEGRPLAAISVGAVGKIMAGPVLPELGQTVMFIYVDKETSDCVHDSADIVAVKGGKIFSLWGHTYKQGMNIDGPKVLPRVFITHNYSVTFSDDGQTIRLSGLVQEYAYRKDGSQSPIPSITTPLPAETYHWDVKTLRFIPEHNYPQAGACVISGRSGAN